MDNELSKVIVEMSINDTSASDISISGFLSECAVATSLINNYMKQMFLLEYTDVPLTEFGYVQEASVSDVKDKIKTAASGAATAVLNVLKSIGKLILNFFNWLFGKKNKLDNLIKKVDSMSGITVMGVDRDSIVNCFGGFLATLTIYEEFAGLVTSMNTTSSSYEKLVSYEKLDRELDTLISVGTSKNPSGIANSSAAETGWNRQADDKKIILAALKNVKEAKPIEKASKILKSLNVNIDNFKEAIAGEPKLMETINDIAKKLNRSYGIYQKKSVEIIAGLVKATEKENKKATSIANKKAASDTYTFEDEDEGESVL